MSELKATPGPWVYFGHRLGCGAQNSRADVAHCHGHDSLRTAEEEQANAHLIAAAPELYEALEGLMAAAGGGAKKCGHDFDCICPYRAAKAALAKARGETS